MTARPIAPADQNAGISDLVRQLARDSKRLAADEVQLAKLETRDNIREAAHGTLWLALALGAGTVALVAFTILLTTLIGRLANGHMWVGALVTGAAELVAALVLIRRGLAKYREPSYTLAESRESLKETAAWVANPRRA